LAFGGGGSRVGLTTELGGVAGMSIACWSRSSFAGT